MVNVSAGGFCRPRISLLTSPPRASYQRRAPQYPVRTAFEMLPAPQPNSVCHRSCVHAQAGASMWKILALMEPSPFNRPSLASLLSRGSRNIAATPPATTTPMPDTAPIVAPRRRKLIDAASHRTPATTTSMTILVPAPMSSEPSANTGITTATRRSLVSQ